MYVRWRRRKNPDRREYGEYVDRETLQIVTGWHTRKGPVYRSVALVESVRIDGKPRQKQIRYIGSYNVDHYTPPDRRRSYQAGFWQDADRILAEAVPDEHTRAKLTAKLETMVPRPDWPEPERQA